MYDKTKKTFPQANSDLKNNFPLFSVLLQNE
jgi:hypothetical protein